MKNRAFPYATYAYPLGQRIRANVSAIYSRFSGGIGFLDGIGYRTIIMADQKQNSEFLGGGPKFNTVGKDNSPAPGQGEPIIVLDRSGYRWYVGATIFLSGYRLRMGGVILLLIVLSGVLFYLNDRDLGKTTVTPAHGGQAVSPDAKNVPVDSNLR